MRKHILVVDDDPCVLAMIRPMLERAGHAVATTDCGHDALRALETGGFDVLITDIFMPSMDGLELIQFVCSRDLNTAIIAVSAGSAMVGHDLLSTSLALGADMTLTKPIAPASLVQAVDRVVIDRSKGLRLRNAEHFSQSSAKVQAGETA